MFRVLALGFGVLGFGFGTQNPPKFKLEALDRCFGLSGARIEGFRTDFFDLHGQSP